MSLFWTRTEPLLLASQSRTRLDMLKRAGIAVEGIAANIDERAVEAGLGATSGEEIARALATAKAAELSARYPNRVVLGADQTLTVDGELLHKPANRAEAARHLATLSGRTHRLTSAAAILCGGRIVAQVNQSADLAMRPLGPESIETYLDSAGEGVFLSVGCYQIEGLGAQLFESIVGDHFTILGLPLLPLLTIMREQGWVAS